MTVLTTTAAAKRLHVTPLRVRQLLVAGILNGEKVGRDWLVTAESVERRAKDITHLDRSAIGKKGGDAYVRNFRKRKTWSCVPKGKG